MLGLLASVLAAAAAPVADAAPAPDTTVAADPAPASHKHKQIDLPPSFPVSPMRKLMQAQLAQAPREDGSGGMTAAEADLVMAHYLASIGKPIVTPQSSSSATGQSGMHP